MDNRIRYWRWGLTAVFSVCVVLVFYDTFFQSGHLLSFFDTLLDALEPVIYGAAMAYLLAPIVDFFDALLKRWARNIRRGLIRALSILLTWSLVLLLFYALLSILIPQLYASVLQLGANLENYYRVIYAWAVQLLNNNPNISTWVTDAIREYYGELVTWIYGTGIPQAQQALALVTGGVVTIVVFLKNILVGVIVSIYLLARKEHSAARSKRLLYSAVSEPVYRSVLRAIHQADLIFSGFVRGKLLDSLIIGVICFVVTSLMNLPYAPLVSVIVGVTNVIPFFGPFLGAIPSAFLILLVNPLQCLYFILFILILQQVDGNLIGPRILGSSTNLSSFWVIVAILVGGGFFGVMGMFFGVPIFACLYSAVNYFSELRLREKGALSMDFFTTAPVPPSGADARADIVQTDQTVKGESP